ncbi:hypothetical protein FRC08_008779 [Ceratobasidium sp. 394]|nr:hypothetical protein FRC08_008779 [Ceratobasidium sp. 394]
MPPDNRPILTPSALLDLLSYLSSCDSDSEGPEDRTSGTEGTESGGASDADDERSPSDGRQSPTGINGSPRFPYESKIIFEGNIWNEIAEADDGIDEVINSGFCALTERERIRLEQEYRRRDWLVGDEVHQDEEIQNSNDVDHPDEMDGVTETLFEESPPWYPRPTAMLSRLLNN